MKRARLSTPALNDLIEIMEHIAKDNPVAADRFGDRMDEAGRLLASSPDLGSLHDDAPPDVRIWRLGNYLLFYREDDCGIHVLRILHGARDWATLLRKQGK